MGYRFRCVNVQLLTWPWHHLLTLSSCQVIPNDSSDFRTWNSLRIPLGSEWAFPSTSPTAHLSVPGAPPGDKPLPTPQAGAVPPSSADSMYLSFSLYSVPLAEFTKFRDLGLS
jgi:hypothetical protein